MYHFTPPTEEFKVGTHPLWGRLKHTRGLAVVRYADGTIKTVSLAPAIEDDVVACWSSGRRYEIDSDTATLLTDAGYGANVEGP